MQSQMNGQSQSQSQLDQQFEFNPQYLTESPNYNYPIYIFQCVYCGSKDVMAVINDGGSIQLCNRCHKTYKAMTTQPQVRSQPQFQAQQPPPQFQPQQQFRPSPQVQPLQQFRTSLQFQPQQQFRSPGVQRVQEYHPEARDPVQPDLQVFGFTAQGEPIINYKQTMSYRSQELLKRQNQKYEEMKKVDPRVIKFEPANQDTTNSYNPTFGNLDEAFSYGVAPQSWGTPAKPNPNVLLQPEASHNQLINGFEQAARNMEETGQIRPQVNPLQGNFPIHLPVSPGETTRGQASNQTRSK